MRGRLTSELSHQLARAARAQVALRLRRVQHLRARLDACDLGRRFAGLRTRLVTADGRSRAAMDRTRHRADARVRDCVGRLESLSPLSVLARGYAVCWNADRTLVVRDAATTAAGDRVRVTLARGELECEVR
jgi:exodeoxyribonuclease VII large subunit